LLVQACYQPFSEMQVNIFEICVSTSLKV
jgi:hypothetical protein